MNKNIFRGALFFLAAAMAAVPAVSYAVTESSAAPIHVNYQTSLTTIPGPSAPWSGTLNLTIHPDGIINGFYHPADNYSAFIPVTGARQGEHVWLDIGKNGSVHVSGTMHGGTITGGAFDDNTNKQYAFSAHA